MEYPLSLVEIPRHNFVRWTVGPKLFIDFETMDGIETDDNYYKRKWGIPDTFADLGGILRTMDEKQIFAYHHASVALAWSWRGDVSRMVDWYLKSISTDQSHSMALNNLAWFYAAAPQIELRDGAKAVEYGLKAVAVLPDGDSLDTLACAYAQSGDFASAIKTENDAIAAAYTPFGSDLQGNLVLFQSAPPRTCNDANFGIDPAPFRPGQGVLRPATDRDLRRLR
jgi:tetratricopeptide (TPR) repeat protein